MSTTFHVAESNVRERSPVIFAICEVWSVVKFAMNRKLSRELLPWRERRKHGMRSIVHVKVPRF